MLCWSCQIFEWDVKKCGAAANGHVDILELLLQDSRISTTAKNVALRVAGLNGRTEIVQYLLNNAQVNITIDDDYVLRSAAANGYTDLVRLVLRDPRVNVNASYGNALRASAKNGHVDIVRLLLEHRSWRVGRFPLRNNPWKHGGGQWR